MRATGPQRAEAQTLPYLHNHARACQANQSTGGETGTGRIFGDVLRDALLGNSLESVTNFPKPLYGDNVNLLHGAVLTQIPCSELHFVTLAATSPTPNLAHELHPHAGVRIRVLAVEKKPGHIFNRIK